ncbi:MAG TPA: cyclic pyranopterin monophosphate synthase MoaC [Trueperaceae bacterium]|nr:cyclic pyranopterin monophosphate synthase MoaC [Trueperaceae bacterium]
MAATHLQDGRPVMVDVSGKQPTRRTAVAESVLRLTPATAARLQEGGEKGDALFTAELAGVMGAKRASELIPLCHPLPLSHVSVKGEVEGLAVRFTATCVTTARTGVEMEALVAASTAALTLYDMLKSAGHDMEVASTRLLAKDGGRSGAWRRA